MAQCRMGLVGFFFLLKGCIVPEDFLKCIREGGRVVTIKIGDDKYRHVCYDKNDKPHYGEIKTKKKKTQAKKKK